MEKYRVVCTKIDEDGNEENVFDELYDGFTLLGTCMDDGRMNEVVMHDNIANIAAKMASGEHTSIAARLACLMMDMDKKKASGLEDLLIDAMMSKGEN